MDIMQSVKDAYKSDVPGSDWRADGYNFESVSFSIMIYSRD